MNNSSDESRLKTFLQKHLTAWRTVSVLLVLAWGLVIYGFSSQNAVESGGLSQQISYDIAGEYNVLFQQNLGEMELWGIARVIEHPVRKLAHMTEYAIFTLFLYQMFASFGFSGKKHYLTSYGTALVYACTDELHQLFSYGRACRFGDVLIDGAGAILMLLILWRISCAVKKHRLKKVNGKI